MDNKKCLFLLFTFLSVFGNFFSSLYSLIPLPIVLPSLGLSSMFFGGQAISAKKAKIENAVRSTIENVDEVVFYVRIFLLAAFIVAFLVLLFLGIRALRKVLLRRKFSELIVSLRRIQSDLIVLSNLSDSDEVLKIKLSKKDSINIVLNLLQKKFFLKKLGKHFCNRMVESLKMIGAEKIDTQNQFTLIEQWLKSIEQF